MLQVTEYDDLPHKICFRCSAKVEELHDFVERCTRAQENLRTLLGKTRRPAAPPKTDARKLWEETLNKSNISNDELCDAVIQKAMEGIKNLPLNTFPLEGFAPKQATTVIDDDSDQSDASNRSKQSVPPYMARLQVPEEKLIATKSNMQTEYVVEMKKNDPKVKQNNTVTIKRTVRGDNSMQYRGLKKINNAAEPTHDEISNVIDIASDRNDSDSDDSANVPIKAIQEKKQEVKTEKTKENSKPFDIMDHISIIKVHGVGVLFQCTLCNRNFLKKDVVQSHGCAKTGVPKLDFLSTVSNVEPVKNPMASVKYINNKVADPPRKDPEPVEPPPAPQVQVKPKAGPASRVKKSADNSPGLISNFVGMKVKPREVTPPPPTQRVKAKPAVTPPPAPPSVVPPSVVPPAAPTAAAIEVPGVPGMKTRYRLVPGANNTFTLVEDQVSGSLQSISKMPSHISPATNTPVGGDPKQLNKWEGVIPQPKRIKVTKNPKSILSPVTLSSAVIDVDRPVEAPYPVGFFTSPKSPLPVQSKPETHAPVTFTTPAMKKQSYTVVQTGNPSKLLISAKPQPQPMAEVVPKPGKGKRQARVETKELQAKPQEPYKVTVEQAALPKDNFFTFISIDPLLQPSYVLPTENIIQESQISTSTNTMAGSSKSSNMYECSLCPQKFSREKKLLTHLQSHYNKMDDDNDEIVKKTKKRARRI